MREDRAEKGETEIAERRSRSIRRKIKKYLNYLKRKK